MIFNFLKILTVIFTVSLITFCSQADKTTTSDQTDTTKQITETTIDRTALSIPNESGTFSIMIKNGDKKEKLIKQKSIYVLDLEKNKIILEDFIIRGKVYWISDNEVKVEKQPGMISKDESNNDLGYIFDVKTNNKTTN